MKIIFPTGAARWIMALNIAAAAVCAASAQETAERTIGAVVLQGLDYRKDQEQSIRSRLEVRQGSAFTDIGLQRAVARDIRRIMELGYFSRISADASPHPEGLTVTYIFEEKRLIEEVRILGADKVKDRVVRGALKLREGDAFAADALPDELDAIVALYESKGFANARVDVVAEPVGSGQTRVIYTIDEGRKARIRSIAFAGNEVLRDRALRKLMETKTAKWFLGGRYEAEKLDYDLQQILDEYGNHGRLEAQVVNVDIAFTDGGKGMDILIQVSEGPEYHVDSMSFANNVVYDDDELSEEVSVLPGEIHDRGQVAEDAETLQQGYRDSGYVNAVVTPQVTLNRDEKTTNVVHNVEEGDLKYLRQITITGNSVTKDEIIRRQLLLEPGDRYDGAASKLSEERIGRTGYFDDEQGEPAVRLTLRDVPGDKRYSDMFVDVEEGKTGTLNFGVGYSTEENLAGFIELTRNNFDITNWPRFTGGGQQLSIRLNIGDVRDQYSISFTDPEFLGYPLSVGFDVFDESFRVTGGANYREETQGAQLRVGKILSPYVTLRGTLRYQTTDLTDLPFFFNEELRRQRGDSTTISTSWSIERNTVDNSRDPARGARHLVSLELAGLGGDHEFFKAQHDSTWYLPISPEEKWILSLRTREGWVEEYGSSDYVPLQDRLYAGGTSTVRGYDTRDIGPWVREFGFWGARFATGGNASWITNVEVKYKINERLRVYGFTDAGTVWPRDNAFDLGEMKYSVGLGLGFYVPILGPIRVDYGIPLNPEDYQGSGRLHLQTAFRF